MAIWYKQFTVDDLNRRGANTLADVMGITFTVIGDNSLTATMPADERTKQPLGIVHGGANVVLAETIASTGANAVVDLERFFCVGLEINANHIRQVREGLVTGIAHPIHLGRTTQVWHIDLFNDEGKITCVSRMTASVVARKP
ncbi:MAG: hotdog fold thioesterase [Legionellales bacterium]|nr:hotdog fold thioesterase [Legionellales bacterium]